MAIGAAASANAIGGIIGHRSGLAILPIAKDIVLLFGPRNLPAGDPCLVIVSHHLRGKIAPWPDHRRLRSDGRVHRHKYRRAATFTYGIEYLWTGASRSGADRPVCVA